MSFSIQKDPYLIDFLNSLPSSIINNNKLTQTNFSDKTNSFSVNTTDAYLFCNGVGITVTLPNPTLNINRNLIFTNRSANQVNSNLNISYVDSTGSILTTTVLLSASVGSWCQLVSNGISWFMVSQKLSNGTPFTFTIDTTQTSSGSTSSTQFKLPLVSTGKYDFLVDWGDGYKSKINQYNQKEITHTYLSSGSKTINITGLCNGFCFNNTGDKLKLSTISQWGTHFRLGRNEGGYFYGCSNLNVTAVDTLNLTGTKNLSSCFRDCSNFNSTVSGWNTASVTNMSYMFSGALIFNNGDAEGLSTKPLNWNTSSVIDMSYMFNSVYAFNQAIGTWNTSLVTNMSYMFQSAITSSFNQYISNWNTSLVTDMSHMFDNAYVFNNGDTTNIYSKPLNWNTSSVTNMNNMFHLAGAFNQYIGTWNTSQVTDMSYMFGGATVFNNGDAPPPTITTKPLLWNTSKVTTMRYMFQNAIAFKQDISNWIPSSCTDMISMFTGDMNSPNSATNQNNYNALLVSWGITNIALLKNLVTFRGGSSKYTLASAGATGRANLINSVASGGKGWTITDGGGK